MHCPQCGSDNPPEYRFCGMCGTPLAKKETPVLESVSVRHEPAGRAEKVESVPVGQERESTSARSERESAPVSSLSGPSFLGLGTEPVRSNGRADSDVSYLFDDEDMRPRRTYWRFLLLLIILGGVGSLFYLQYRKEGKTWVAPWSHEKAQTPVQASQTQNPPAQPNANASDRQSTNNQAGGNPSAPASSNSQSAGNTSQPQDQTNTTSKNSEPAQDNTAQSTDANSANQQGKSTDGAAQKETAKADVPASDSAETTDTEQPAKRVRATKPKMARPAAPSVSPDDALVANAEKYLYGRGVPQNCDRALSSLRPAADRSNTRARTLLGTMYATGHCVPKDLPNAYRWFALASRTSPDNMWVQRNLEMIWREMTPQERQLATRSQ